MYTKTMRIGSRDDIYYTKQWYQHNGKLSELPEIKTTEELSNTYMRYAKGKGLGQFNTMTIIEPILVILKIEYRLSRR